MRIARWAAVTGTALMSLMDLPVAVGSPDPDIPAAPAWAITLLGVIGLVAAAGLARRRPWGLPAVLATGALNLAGAVTALVHGWSGAAIGLAITLTTIAAALLSRREQRGLEHVVA